MNALEAVRMCDSLFLEHYTSILGVDVPKLEAFYGKSIILADREMVESNSDTILNDAKDKNIGLLIVGDPFWYVFHDLFNIWLFILYSALPRIPICLSVRQN